MDIFDRAVCKTNDNLSICGVYFSPTNIEFEFSTAEPYIAYANYNVRRRKLIRIKMDCVDREYLQNILIPLNGNTNGRPKKPFLVSSSVSLGVGIDFVILSKIAAAL